MVGPQKRDNVAWCLYCDKSGFKPQPFRGPQHRAYYAASTVRSAEVRSPLPRSLRVASDELPIPSSPRPYACQEHSAIR